MQASPESFRLNANVAALKNLVDGIWMLQIDFIWAKSYFLGFQVQLINLDQILALIKS